jgi:hypothetical protein
MKNLLSGGSGGEFFLKSMKNYFFIFISLFWDFKTPPLGPLGPLKLYYNNYFINCYHI